MYKNTVQGSEFHLLVTLTGTGLFTQKSYGQKEQLFFVLINLFCCVLVLKSKIYKISKQKPGTGIDFFAADHDLLRDDRYFFLFRNLNSGPKEDTYLWGVN